MNRIINADKARASHEGYCKHIAYGLFFFCLTFLFSRTLISQVNKTEFDRIAIEQGLSQGSVNCIVQDNLGFIWIGTQNGLNRFDGHEYKPYTQSSTNKYSLSHNTVTSLSIDREGILWIGTYGGGLNSFDPKTEKFMNYNSDPDRFGVFKGQNVFAIGEDKDRILWVGTDEGLYMRKPGENRFTQYKDREGNSIPKIKVIYTDEAGQVWVGAESGLYRYNHVTRDFTLNQIVPGNTFYNEVDAIADAQAGMLWIGTPAGLYRFFPGNQEGERFKQYPGELKDKQIDVIYKENIGTTWVGTQTDGLTRIDTEGDITTYKNIPGDITSLSSNKVSAIYQDRSGLLWIGTAGGGINRFDPQGKQFSLYKNILGDETSLNHNDIRGICEDKDGMIWIGTNGNGINRFDPVSKKFKHYLIGKEVNENPRRNNVHCIFVDHANILWVGTVRGGLYKFNPQTEKFTHFTNSNIQPDQYVLEIREDNSKRLWIGTLDNGLTVLDEKREKSENFKNIKGNPDSISNNKVFSLFPDEDGNLWIGTGGGGLNKLNLKSLVFDGKEDEKFLRFQSDPAHPLAESISDNFISAIHRDKKGRLWLGTGGGGLNRLINEREKSFHVYTKEDGLPDNVVYAILEDNNGNLWLSTNRGLSKFNPETDEFRNYSPNDGLQGNEFNRGSAWKSRGGIMYFGGFNGFNQFDPKEIRYNFPKPTIVITSFKKLNKNVPLEPLLSEKGELELSYRDTFLSFGFAALSFADPNNNQYAFKLEPINREWTYLENKHNIDFSSLKPGKYTLKIIGSNSHGVWNEEGTALKIRVFPPFWQTWWFLTLAIVIILTGSTFFIMLNTIKMKRLNKWLERQVAKRTVEINHKREELRKTNENLKKEIEERIQAEGALKESEERYRTLVETSPDAIVLSDILGGSIIMANPQSAALCGYKDVEEMQRHVTTIFDLMEEMSRELAFKNSEKIIHRGITRNAEYTILSKTGAPIAVEISVSLIKDTNGHPQYLLSIIRDIRERKEAEKKEKLQREKLIQVDKMASLGRLLSGVAHEINNPASSLKMNSEIFDRVWRDVAPVLEEYYKNNNDFSLAGLPYTDAKTRLDDLIIGSLESAQRIEKIIKDLKDFSRPGDDSASEPIDINKVVDSSVSLTHNLLKKSTRHFSMELAKDLPVISGNPQKLDQVMINLIQNACQALPDNTKAITITTVYDKEKNQIIIRVKDEGRGIKEKDLKYITDPFFTTRREQGGTGLGLSISQQIIQDHHGTLNFDSQVDKGTTVTVCLPESNENAI